MLDQIWNILNSPIAVMVIAAIIGIILNKIYQIKPGWKKYEPIIVEAVRAAEKASNKEAPDGKLAFALDYVCAVLEERGNPATKAKRKLIEDGIRIIHAKIENWL